MNKEIKDVLHLLLLISPLFAVMILGWLCSPMHTDVKAGQRFAAQEYLSRTYFYPDVPDRAWLIEKYGFTDNEINPSEILRQFASGTDYNQNLGGLE